MKASDMLRRPPLVVEMLDPTDFADRWTSRPNTPVAVGIRFISDLDEGEARIVAAQSAKARYADTKDVSAAEAEYNDELMARIVGASLCDPNDVSRDAENLVCSDETARQALRSATIRRLFQRIELMRDEFLLGVEADDEEVESVGVLLSNDILSELPDDKQRRARRLIQALSDLLT